VFILFLAGLVLVMQGFVGKEINPEGQPFAMAIDLEHPGVEHPRERHRARLMLSGAGLIATAVLLAIVLL
jgi:hypothetical protein